MHDLQWRLVVALEEFEQLPGDGPLGAPPDLSQALALRPPARRIGAGCRVLAQPDQGHGVAQRPTWRLVVRPRSSARNSSGAPTISALSWLVARTLATQAP